MANGKAGRPSDYTEELAERICEILATSDTSLRDICKRPGMPHLATAMRWLDRHEEFASKYAHAREVQADVVYADMAGIEQKMITRKLASDVGRVVLQSKQWRAAKLAAKKYGDKVAIGGASDLPPLQTEARIDVGSLTPEQLRALASIPVQSR